MKHYTLYNRCRGMLLAIVLGLVCAGSVWGQHYPDNWADMGQETEIIYVNTSNPDKEIRLQEDNASANMDGYIRWYVSNNNGQRSITNIETITDVKTYQGYTYPYPERKENDNYIVWERAQDTDMPDRANAVRYTSYNEGDTVVCEASSVAGNNPIIALRHKYVIKSAKERVAALGNNQKNLEVYTNWRNNSTAFMQLAKASTTDKAKCFFEAYEVHTPLTQALTGDEANNDKFKGTSYRLNEKLSNYFITSTSTAQTVRWSVFSESGEKKSQYTVSSNIWTKNFDQKDGINLNATKTQVLYLVAEVGSSENANTWYPVSFIKLYLEPYQEALTQSELNAKSAAGSSDYLKYYRRTEDYLLKNKFTMISSVTFEKDENTDISIADLKNHLSENFTTKPMVDANSNYAFGYSAQFSDRKANRIGAGRNEYVLLRTLNYPDVSEIAKGSSNGYKPVSIDGKDAVYETWFAGSPSGNGWTYRYNNFVLDRLADQNGGEASSKSGYFLFIDASDDPGVITKMTLNEELCDNTRLVVTAWVCDLATKSGVEHADVELTIKGVDANNNETILTKYYSGKIRNKTSERNTGAAITGDGAFGNFTRNKAEWQQIYFTFSFDKGNSNYKSYLVEIANNCPSSTGADYAIDDIRMYMSNPGISVDRKDACTSSILNVYSNYQTLLDNMDWDEDQYVLMETEEELKKESSKIRKYRYGLMGNDPDAELHTTTRTKGNIYFAFFDDKNWIYTHKGLNGDPMQLSVPVRVIVDTDFDQMPIGQEAAAKEEVKVNIQAILDYNADNNRNTNDGYGVADFWPNSNPIEINLSDFGITETIDRKDYADQITKQVLDYPELYADKYKELIERLYAILGIPRIRIAWRGEGNDAETIYLTNIDVENTGLKYVGEPNPDGGTYSGKYNVVLFSGRQIAESEDASKHFDIDYILNNDCALKEEFLVKASTTIAIQTMMDTETAICKGALRKITASLNAYDKVTNEPLTEDDWKKYQISYVLDWYMGPRVGGYDNIAITYNDTPHTLKEALAYFRQYYSSSDVFTGEITTEILDTWINSGDNTKSAIATELKTLVNNGDLRTGIQPGGVFEAYIESKQIVALPYVYGTGNLSNIDICQEEANVDINISSEDTPIITPGIPNVTLNDHISALRLGERHLKEGVKLTIPINDAKHHDDATHLGLVENKENPVLMKDMTEVGKVTTLKISKSEVDGLTAELTIQWDDNAAAKLVEGNAYELLIPFVQYSNEYQLHNHCDGLASIFIKVVPEYLTWNSDGKGTWYVDANWRKSHNKELYMDDKSETTDANGTESLQGAFAPLYFTKVTVPDNLELTLTEYEKDDQGVLKLPADETNNTDDIKYDMAIVHDQTDNVYDDKDDIKPYYINKVREIYFKPKATLMNQHYLTYDTARVEFNMTASTPYWMSSPLQAVYAGDMYAPTTGGKQNTPAFEYITYDTNKNSRWNPAFYQKSWDKDIAYSTVEDGSASTSVNAVKSNWSIEYNDVWVPYSLGKGFYARVEEKDVKVRLPKADKEYTYEEYIAPTTKAGLSSVGTRDSSGRMANGKDIVITLNDEAVDGDGDHFLVGNPYMTYLNMDEFFKKNTDLNKKYWTVEGGATKVAVGTPDVNWTGNETEDGTDNKTISGFVPPMTAFFVERAGYTEPTTKADDAEPTPTEISVTFTTEMIASKAEAEGTESSETLRSKSLSATAPVLHLLAERDGLQSASLITQRDAAHNGYEADEDAIVLLDSELDAPVAYSVAGSHATQVNALRSIDNIPLGLYNNAGRTATLTLSGISEWATPLYLYDAQQRISTPLTGDSYTFTIDGESHGRYFLRADGSPTGNEAIDGAGLTIYSVRPGRVIVAATEAVESVQAVSPSGQVVRSFSPRRSTFTFDLPQGIYIIRAVAGDAVRTVKLRVR